MDCTVGTVPSYKHSNSVRDETAWSVHQYGRHQHWGPNNIQDMLPKRIDLHKTIQGYQFFLLLLSKILLYSRIKSLPNKYSLPLFRFTVDWDCLKPQEDAVGNHKYAKAELVLWTRLFDSGWNLVRRFHSHIMVTFLSVQWQSYRLDNPGFDCQQRQNVSFPKRPDRLWAPHSYPYNRTRGIFLKGRAVDE